MQQQALKMIAAMLSVGVLITVISWNPLPLIVMTAVSYAMRQRARRLR
jgi:hypothetical protein